MSPDELSALKDYLEKEGNLGEYWKHGGLKKSIKIGVIAEEHNDVEVLLEYTAKLIARSSFSFARFVGHGCGAVRRKCRAWAENLVQTRVCRYCPAS